MIGATQLNAIASDRKPMLVNQVKHHQNVDENSTATVKFVSCCGRMGAHAVEQQIQQVKL